MKFIELVKQSMKDFSSHIIDIAIIFFCYQLIILGVNVYIGSVIKPIPVATFLNNTHSYDYVRYTYFICKSFNFMMYGLMLTHFIFYINVSKDYKNHLILRSMIQPILMMGNLFKHVLFIVFLSIGSNFTYLFRSMNSDFYMKLREPVTMTLYGNMNYLFFLTIFISLIYVLATLSQTYFSKSTTLSNFFFYSLDCLKKKTIINSNIDFLKFKGLFLKIVFLSLIVSMLSVGISVFSVSANHMLFNIALINFINMWAVVFIASATVKVYRNNCSSTVS